MISVLKVGKPSIYHDKQFIEGVNNFNAELKQTNKANFKYFQKFKKKLLKHLWEETSGKCVYCEIFLGGMGNGDVEHFFPKSKYPDLTFEWSNMFLVCKNCNSLKANRDPNIFKIVHPSQDNPSDHLKLNSEGVYIPLTEKGSNTINLFRLNGSKIPEHNIVQNLFDRLITNPKGEDGLSDEVASEDLLGRELLVNELSSFYTEYNEGNSSPLYMGIFSRWGMGKSSFIEMLTKNIEAKNSETNKYLVCKVDCSLFHKKEKLWITILNKLLDEISTMKKKKNSKKKEKPEKVFKFNFFSFKTRFFLYNLLAWLKRRWKLDSLIFLSLIGIYYLITKSFPNVPIPKDYKEITALITVITLVFTLIKTRTLIFKQNVFLQDDRNEESSFIRSTKEYEQLISLIIKAKKKKNLKILLVLDEMDRMHKDLLPDIIELIQLFKGLNNKQIIKKSNTESNISDESVISFVFSFNQDMLFPVIGKSVSLDDKQLFINSYRNYEGYVEGEGKEAYLNFYKLGKEYMDKYLDLTVYLEEEIDYTQLMEELFKEDKVTGSNKSKKSSSDNGEAEMLEQIYSEVGSIQQSAQNSAFNSDKQESPSFSELEMKVIRKTVRKNASKVEPRKVKRLKNALIMLKKLNKEIDSMALENGYEEELRDFILNFLEIKNSEQQVSDSAYNEIATTVEDSIEDKSSNSRVNMTRQLKYTEYFIHNKFKK